MEDRLYIQRTYIKSTLKGLSYYLNKKSVYKKNIYIYIHIYITVLVSTVYQKGLLDRRNIFNANIPKY